MWWTVGSEPSQSECDDGEDWSWGGGCLTTLAFALPSLPRTPQNETVKSLQAGNNCGDIKNLIRRSRRRFSAPPRTS